MTADERAAYVERIVATAGPLTAIQREVITAAFAGLAPSAAPKAKKPTKFEAEIVRLAGELDAE